MWPPPEPVLSASVPGAAGANEVLLATPLCTTGEAPATGTTAGGNAAAADMVGCAVPSDDCETTCPLGVTPTLATGACGNVAAGCR